MTTPPPPGSSSPGISPMLGTRGLQTATNQLQTAINSLSGVVNRLSNALPATNAGQNRPPGNGQWNAGSNFAAGGQPNGGQPTWASAARGAVSGMLGRMAAPNGGGASFGGASGVNQGGRGGGGGPGGPGGGGGPGAQGGGRPNGGIFSGAFGQLANAQNPWVAAGGQAGQAMLASAKGNYSNTITWDAYAHQASLAAGTPWRASSAGGLQNMWGLGQAFLSMGFGTQDSLAQAAGFTQLTGLSSYQNLRPGTFGQNVMSGMRGLSFASGGSLSGKQLAGLSQTFAGPKMTMGAARMGGGFGLQTPQSVAAMLINTYRPVTGSRTNNQYQQFSAMETNMRNNLGMSQADINNFVPYMQQLTALMGTGKVSSIQQAQDVLTNAESSHPSQFTQSALDAAGITKSALQKDKQVASAKLMGQLGDVPSSAKGIKAADDALENFANLLNKFKDSPVGRWISKVSGYTGKVDSGTGGGVSGFVGGLMGQSIGTGSSGSPGSSGGSASKSGIGGTQNALMQKIISAIESKNGDSYVWGATGPNTFDCSGLMQWGFAQGGVQLARTSQDQWAQYKDKSRVDINKVQPGDLVFRAGADGSATSPGHVGMYVGGNKTFEARSTADGIGYFPFNASSWNTGAVRVMGDVSLGDQTIQPGQQQQQKPAQMLGSFGIGGNTGDNPSVEELDALMAALAGSGPGIGSSGRKSTGNSNNSTASGDTSGTPTSGPPGNVAPGDAAAAKAYAKAVMAGAPWNWGSSAEWSALEKLWTQESNWDSTAVNPSSKATGISQLLPSAHAVPKNWNDPKVQITWGLNYIKGRSDERDPIGAWQHEQQYNWYADGAFAVRSDEMAQLHKGEMVLPAQTAERVRDAMARDALFRTVQPGGPPGGGSGSGLYFAKDSIKVVVSGSMTNDSARQAATTLVQEIERQTRYKNIGQGATSR